MSNTNFEIVLVEDNLNDAELTMRALRKKNLVNSFIHLKDGAEAIDFFMGTGEYQGRDVTEVPRLILLDLKMPRVDGIELLQILKSHETTKKIPVVVLTSSREHPDIERCYALGANSFIVKPVGFDNFMSAVSELGVYWLMLNEPPYKWAKGI